MIRTFLFLTLWYWLMPPVIDNVSWAERQADKYQQMKVQAVVIAENPAFRLPVKGN